MPELPEVETVRRGLQPAMQGQRIVDISLSDKSLRFPYPPDFRQSVQGQIVEGLSRRGKYMWAHLANGAAVIIHLGMSGSFRIVPQDHRADTPQKHDHMTLIMGDGTHIIYNDPRRFGFVDVVHGDPQTAYKPFQLMGPEPLSDEFTADYLPTRLVGVRAPIKQALLDQSVVAGLGNIYVCEALYRSGIHPKRAAARIGAARLKVLTAHIKDVLQEAIASGGSSLRDHKGVDGTMGYFQHHFDVYGREGEICAHEACRLKGQPCIKRITQSGRSTFYCVNTQR